MSPPLFILRCCWLAAFALAVTGCSVSVKTAAGATSTATSTIHGVRFKATSQSARKFTSSTTSEIDKDTWTVTMGEQTHVFELTKAEAEKSDSSWRLTIDGKDHGTVTTGDEVVLADDHVSVNRATSSKK